MVHCSAGVGRTGTLIGLDTLAREIECGREEVDVFNAVYRMREDRELMVQKAVQYRYLYQCVAEYAREKKWPQQARDGDNKAGADLLLVCHDQEQVRASMVQVRRDVLSGETPLRRLMDAYGRVVAVRARLGRRTADVSLAAVRDYFKG